jgi:hypothetical protein
MDEKTGEDISRDLWRQVQFNKKQPPPPPILD